MTTKEIATKLADYCRNGKWTQAQQELYADDVVSIEPHATEDFEQETKGLKNLFAKGEKFESMVESRNNIRVSEPVVAPNSFAFVLEMDVVMKKGGQMNMEELCVYTVKDGKITSEQFFV